MSAPAPVLDAKALAIAALSVTACILFVGLLLVTTQPVYGIGQTDRGGDYIMLTQQLTNSQEGVLIIDAASRQMTLYALNGSNRQLQILHSNIRLDDLPGSGRDRKPGP